jgi:hypothetical protein
MHADPRPVALEGKEFSSMCGRNGTTSEHAFASTPANTMA